MKMKLIFITAALIITIVGSIIIYKVKMEDDAAVHERRFGKDPRNFNENCKDLDFDELPICTITIGRPSTETVCCRVEVYYPGDEGYRDDEDLIPIGTGIMEIK